VKRKRKEGVKNQELRANNQRYQEIIDKTKTLSPAKGEIK
jgi:hypothetical protein